MFYSSLPNEAFNVVKRLEMDELLFRLTYEYIFLTSKIDTTLVFLILIAIFSNNGSIPDKSYDYNVFNLDNLNDIHILLL